MMGGCRHESIAPALATSLNILRMLDTSISSCCYWTGWRSDMKAVRLKSDERSRMSDLLREVLSREATKTGDISGDSGTNIRLYSVAM